MHAESTWDIHSDVEKFKSSHLTGKDVDISEVRSAAT